MAKGGIWEPCRKGLSLEAEHSEKLLADLAKVWEAHGDPFWSVWR